jgi:hypothetical protein
MIYKAEHGPLIQAVACGVSPALIFYCLDRDLGFQLTEKACEELLAYDYLDQLTSEQQDSWIEAAVEALADAKELPKFP